jgi:uncharacterized membrane protein
MAEHDLIPPNVDPDSEPDPSEHSRFTLPQIIEIKYDAPLPPPHMLREFEEILPGAADRIFTLMESQTQHRQNLENQKQTSGIGSEYRGQIIGFILSLVAMLAGFILIYKGKSLPGTIVFITTCASLVGIFIAGKLSQKKERQEKLEELGRMLARSINAAEDTSEPPNR